MRGVGPLAHFKWVKRCHVSHVQNESSMRAQVDMWQPMSGKKSTIKDKVDKV